MTRLLLRTSFTVWCFIGILLIQSPGKLENPWKSHIHGSLSPSIITPLSRPSLPCLPLKTPNLRWSISSWIHAHNHSRVLTCPDSGREKVMLIAWWIQEPTPFSWVQIAPQGNTLTAIHQVIYDHVVAFPMGFPMFRPTFYILSRKPPGAHQRQGTRPAPGPPSDCLPPSALRRCGTCAPPPSGRPGRCGTPWPPGAGLVIHGERKVTCWQLFNGV